MDLLIAAHALAAGATLATNNPREFRRIAGLDVEDWLDSLDDDACRPFDHPAQPCPRPVPFEDLAEKRGGRHEPGPDRTAGIQRSGARK